MAIRLQLYGLASTAAFALTIVNAFRQRPNFYSAAVYLSKSSACTMVLWNQAVFQTILFGKIMQKVFFGNLRMIEVERLQERSWFAITETLLALTIFKDEFDSSFIILFISLLFVKVFHWLASDRVEWMEQTATVPKLFHWRMVALLFLLWLVDSMLIVFATECILVEGASVMIMFASEYLIMAATLWSTSMKYALNAIDQRTEEPWEAKSMYIFYVELVSDFFKLVTYLLFFTLILSFYGLPLNILRDVYITLRSFVLKVRDLRRLRQATRNMETLYPNATQEELDRMSDKTCIICREDMEFRSVDGTGEQQQSRRGPNDTPKKLPCGHVFHFHCLRSWLERQQSCPTCRRSVLESAGAATNPQNGQPQPPQGIANGRPAEAGPHPFMQAPQQPGQPMPTPTPTTGTAPAGGAPTVSSPQSAKERLEQAQLLVAYSLGQQTYEAMFPGQPLPDVVNANGGLLPSFLTERWLDEHDLRNSSSSSSASTSTSASASPKNPLAAFRLRVPGGVAPLPTMNWRAQTDPNSGASSNDPFAASAPRSSSATTANGWTSTTTSQDDKGKAKAPDAVESNGDVPIVTESDAVVTAPSSAREAARRAAELRAATPSLERINHDTMKRPSLADLRRRTTNGSTMNVTDSALSSPTRLAEVERRLDDDRSKWVPALQAAHNQVPSSIVGEKGEDVGEQDDEDRVKERMKQRLDKLVALEGKIGSLIDELRSSLD